MVVALCTSQYQRGESTGAQDTAASPTEADQQWSLCQAQQSHLEHAETRRTLHRLGVRTTECLGGGVLPDLQSPLM